MWGVIPVAGEGSRLRAVTEGSPKCLVDVGGRPLLHHLLDRMAPVCEGLCVVVPPDRTAIEEALDAHPWGRGATTVVQEAPRGLRDAVSRAVPRVSAPMLILMGDGWFGAPLAPCLAPMDPGEGGLLVEPGVPDPGEPAGWVIPDTDGRAARVWKGEPEGPRSIRIAGGFVLEARATAQLAGSPGPGSFEALVDDVVREGAAYRLLEVVGPRFNVNTPAQLAALRALQSERIHGGAAQLGG